MAKTICMTLATIMDRTLSGWRPLRVALASISVALISGCSSGNLETERGWLKFDCPDGRVVLARFEPKDEFVSVQFEGRDLRLPHVISGSGARYSDGQTTFWNKGRSALVEVNDKIVVQDCMLEKGPYGFLSPARRDLNGRWKFPEVQPVS